VGGGGLIGGIAGYLKTVRPSVRVIGCLPARSPVMYECIQAGRIVDGTVLPTISDGTAGGVEEDAITFELCRQYVDDWIVTPEEAIEDAMRSVFEEHSLVIEGAAGLGLAALRSYSRDDRDALSPAVLVLCGGNIEIDRFKKIVC
jgi:threonine dehydratase